MLVLRAGLKSSYGSLFLIGVFMRAQTDQTTTLCVQEVEIYLERWEVLGALVGVYVDR